MKKCYKKLKKLRMQKNLSYQDMATMLKISKSFYWQLEHKERKLYYEIAIDIANILGCTPDTIFYEK